MANLHSESANENLSTTHLILRPSASCGCPRHGSRKPLATQRPLRTAQAPTECSRCRFAHFDSAARALGALQKLTHAAHSRTGPQM